MPLANPRSGESLGFHLYPSVSVEGTLGNPESIIWASIRQLCSRAVGEGIARSVHGVHRKRDVEDVAKNLKIYIRQASEFYDAAKFAKPNTGPLIYYYAFLNLAKAYCELKNPRLHERAESYGHGVSWRPNRQYLVNVEKDRVSLTRRGVWHLLWESLVRLPCNIPNPTHLKIKDLFAYCPEIGIEYDRTIGGSQKFVDLEKPDVLYDETADEVWVNFSVHRWNLKLHRLSIPALLRSIRTSRTGYEEVKAHDREYRAFQSATA